MSCAQRNAEKAQAWDALMELCGNWQDGSAETVRLTQDEATRECHVVVMSRFDPPKVRFVLVGSTFEVALRHVITK